MKPYKILKPEVGIWGNAIIQVSVTEKKAIKLPLRLITNCHPLPRNIASKIKIVNHE